MPVAAIGAGIAAVGAIGSAIEGQNAAKAQGQIAQSQQARADQAMAFAAPTAAELDTLSKQMDNYSKFYGQAQTQMDQLGKQLTDTYGSNILEQGKQLHDQLTGGQSQAVQAATDARSRQRQQLQSQLISQLGPAAMTSSAGQQAMQNFDFQTDQYTTQVGQQSIQNLIQGIGGLQGSQSQSLQGIMGLNSQLTGMLGNIQQTQNSFQTRQAQAALGSAQYQGGQYVGDLQSAKAGAATFGSIANIGGQVLGASLMGSAQKNAADPTANLPNPDTQQASGQNGSTFSSFQGNQNPLGGNMFGSLSGSSGGQQYAGGSSNFGGLGGTGTF